jgi:hypothetical protein
VHAATYKRAEKQNFLLAFLLALSIIVVGKPVAWGNFCLLIGIEK